MMIEKKKVIPFLWNLQNLLDDVFEIRKNETVNTQPCCERDPESRLSLQSYSSQHLEI